MKKHLMPNSFAQRSVESTGPAAVLESIGLLIDTGMLEILRAETTCAPPLHNTGDPRISRFMSDTIINGIHTKHDIQTLFGSPDAVSRTSTGSSSEGFERWTFRRLYQTDREIATDVIMVLFDIDGTVLEHAFSQTQSKPVPAELDRRNTQPTRLVFERPLTGKDHGHFGVGLVAGFDDFPVPHGSAGLRHGGNLLPNTHVHAVPKRKEAV